MLLCMYVFVCKLLWINNYLLCYKLFIVYKSLKRDGIKIKEIEKKEKYGKKSKNIFMKIIIILFVIMYLYVSCYE